MSRRSWHKRNHDGRKDHDPISGRLRHIRDLLQSNRAADALGSMNSLLAAAQDNPTRQSVVLSLAADGQMSSGNFSRAASIYERACALAPTHPGPFLRAAVGKTLALLKAGQVAAAADHARSTLDKMTGLSAAYSQTFAGGAGSDLAAGGTLVVGRRPARPAVVARRLGRLFLAEGETSIAQEFARSAIAAEPAGSVTGQLTLMEIALRQGRVSDAYAIGMAVWQSAQPTIRRCHLVFD